MDRQPDKNTSIPFSFFLWGVEASILRCFSCDIVIVIEGVTDPILKSAEVYVMTVRRHHTALPLIGY